MGPFFIIIALLMLIWFLKSLFSAPKSATPPQKKSTPAKKAAPPKPAPPKPKPQKPAAPEPNDDPTYLRVKNHELAADYHPAPNQPKYVEGIAHVEALLQEHVPEFMLLCIERITDAGAGVPEAIAKLPKHPKYIAGTCINVISADGKLFCVNIHPYTVSDQTRANFCKRLAKKLGCGCQLYTAQLPNSKGEMVERVLGCIISRGNAAGNVPKKEDDPVIPVTEDVITPIPVTVESLEWEEIDEEE